MSGQYYYQAQHYDPNVGRFLQTDPVEPRPKEMNRYVYVRNNPLNFVDPMGEVMCKNNSDVDLPYKGEGDNFKDPSVCRKGQTCDVDGFYMPDHRCIKVRDGALGCEVDKDLTVSGWGLACEVSKKDLQLDKFRNWPDPYSGRHWPYPAW